MTHGASRDTLAPPALVLAQYKRIVVLTGAGISVASGLRPYRGQGGLWNDHPEMVSWVTAGAMRRDPEGVWSFVSDMREQVQNAKPNAAHVALANAQSKLAPGAEMFIVTQNVDGLHQRAGSTHVIELHGSLARTRCSSRTCDLPVYADNTIAKTAPRCPRCGAVCRHDVVLFDEEIPVDPEWETKKSLRGCDLFLAVGTSGTVYPAANLVRSAEYEGARTMLINLDPMSPRNPAYQTELLGRAEEILPTLFDALFSRDDLDLALTTRDDELERITYRLTEKLATQR
ncbi:MAG: NAD-dependent deacylase [Polyangiaceae bacterium]